MLYDEFYLRLGNIFLWLTWNKLSFDLVGKCKIEYVLIHMEWEFQVTHHQIFKHFEAIVAEQNQLLLLVILMSVIAVLISDENN